MVAGRVFNDLDNDESQRVVVINQSMTKLWDGTDPIGSRVSLPDPPRPGERPQPGQPPPTEWFTVVGVVGDVRQFGLAQETVAQIYRAARAVAVWLRRPGARPHGRAIRRVSATCCAAPCVPSIPTSRSRTCRPSTICDRRHWPHRVSLRRLLGVFAALALLVTLAGIGGVIATSVQQRTKEFGLRMALGAGRDSVLTMVVRQGLTLVADRSG